MLLLWLLLRPCGWCEEKREEKGCVWLCECWGGIKHGDDIVEENDALLGEGFDFEV